MGMIHTLRAGLRGREVLRLDRVALPVRGVLAVLGKGGSGKSTLLRALAGRLAALPEWEVRLECDGLPGPVAFVPQRRRSEERCREAWGPAPCAAPLPAGCTFAAPDGACAAGGGTCALKWNALMQEALQSPAPMILLDEPEGGVPGYSLDALAEVLRDLRRTSTIVLVTHHLAFAERVCDSALFLEDGRKLMQAEREEFFQGPTHYRVQEFLTWGG
jgi:ABC-type polar amino acid transport system ATPase subunit